MPLLSIPSNWSYDSLQLVKQEITPLQDRIDLLTHAFDNLSRKL